MQTIVDSVYSGSLNGHILLRETLHFQLIWVLQMSHFQTQLTVLWNTSAHISTTTILPGESNLTVINISDYSDNSGNTHYFDLAKGRSQGQKSKYWGTSEYYFDTTMMIITG